MKTPLVITPEKRPPPLNVIGEKLTVLADRARTGGYELFLQEGRAGQGPGPHHHDWDESFYVLSGEVAFGYDEQEMTATPGTLVHLPAGTTHWFRFRGDGAMLSITGAGSNAAAFFTQIDAEGANQTDPGGLLRIADAHEVRFQAPSPPE